MDQGPTNKEALELYSRQLEIEHAAPNRFEGAQWLNADQGMALRLVIAHGFLGVIEVLEQIKTELFNRNL